MKRAKLADFPELRRVFSGYLHEDFLEEYDSPAAALRAFFDDANATERRRFQAEAQALRERIETLEFKEARELLSRLGCRWTPASRRALTALLTETASL